MHRDWPSASAITVQRWRSESSWFWYFGTGVGDVETGELKQQRPTRVRRDWLYATAITVQQLSLGNAW